MASEQLKKVIDIVRSQQPSGASEPTIERLRAGMEKVAERVASDVRCEPIIAGRVRAEWVVPPGADTERVLLYFHGGGYVMGSINTHRAMVARMARAAGARALMIDYRLAPRDAKTPLPACAVPISPWTDVEGTGASVKTKASRDPMVREADLLRYGALYGKNTDLRNPLVSPLYGDYRGLPSLLIQVGEAEILLDDSMRVAERAKQAGVQVDLEVWDDMVHVWHVFAKLLPEGQQAIEKMGAYVNAHTP